MKKVKTFILEFDELMDSLFGLFWFISKGLIGMLVVFRLLELL